MRQRLIVISIWIGIEAVHRLSAPVAVQPKLMMVVAAAGVLMNGVIAALFWGVARDVNMRSAFLHMAGDTLSTAAVIAGGAGDPVYRAQLDRSGAFAGDCRADSVDQHRHRAGDSEYPARRHATRRDAQRDSLRNGGSGRRA